MKYGSVLQRRLVQLESAIKVPTAEGRWAAIQTEALTRLSLEDLRILRDIVVKQAAGIAVEDTPENDAVIQRAEAILAEAYAEYYAPTKNTRVARS